MIGLGRRSSCCVSNSGSSGEGSSSYVFNRNGKATNSYLRIGDVFSNISGVITPNFDIVITEIVAKTKKNETWIAEIHKDNLLISGATITISNNSIGTEVKNIEVSANSLLSAYVKGTQVEDAIVIVYFKKK
jgi:hypothetical protein